MSRNLRAVLGATAAISALILSSGAAAQAVTVRPAKPTASAHPPSRIRSATLNAPIGDVQIFSAYPGGGCLTSNGYGQQATVGSIENGEPTHCGYTGTVWDVEPVTAVDSRGGEWVTLMDLSDNFCLDAQDNATGSPNTNGDHVNSWPCDLASQQQWYLWPLGAGEYMIVSHFNTNKVLDGRTSGGLNPGTPPDPVQVWDHLSNDLQQTWIIEPVS